MNTSFANTIKQRFGRFVTLETLAGDPTGSGANDGGAAVPPRTDASIPLYLSGAIVQSAGLAAVSFQLAEANFAVFTIGLTFLGTAVSFLLRKAGAPTRLLRSGAILLGLIFLCALRGAGIFGALVPPEEVGSQEMLLVSALAFTATFSSFLLLTDEAVIFTCVWTIAMIGLTGTVNINSELPICFVIFLAAASFLLVHQNALSFGGGSAGDDGNPLFGAPNNDRGGKLFPWLHLSLPRWSVVRVQAIMAGAAWLISLMLGVLIAIPVQMIGRNMSLGSIIQRLKVPPSNAARVNSGAGRLIFDNPMQFSVGLGPVDDDPTERMSVWTVRPEYWRGRTYDVYDGHGWSSSFADRPPDIAGDPNTLSRDGNYTYDLRKIYANDAARRRTERIVNTFHVSAGTYGPIYHAAEPKVLRTPLFRIFVRPDHTLSGGRGLSTDYEVESDVTTARPSDLRRSSTSYPQEIASQYLSVGPYFSDALHELADEAVAGMSGNPYDKASSIRRFIAGRCTYTRDAPAVPKDRDAAEYFLNDSHEGYCDLYATAMVLLCRYEGLPARVATGFAPGIEIDGDTDPKPAGASDPRRRYSLRGSDLHAWAEVYFTGYGWIDFDATIDTGGVAPVKETPKPVEKRRPFADALRRLLPTAFFGLGAAGIGFVIWNERRGRAERNAAKRAGIGGGDGSTDREALRILGVYRAAVRALRRRGGIAFHPSSTTGEVQSEVCERLGDAPAAAFEPLTRLVEQALYTPSRLTPADTVRARQSLRALKAELKRVPRRRPSPPSAVKETNADAAAR